MRLTFTALIFLMLLPGCGPDVPTGIDQGETPIQFTYTAEDSLEAKLLSLWWSREVLPPDSLTGEFLYDLAYLRHAYGDSVPVVTGLRFIPHWVHSRIVVQFDASTGPSVEEGDYAPWDALEPALQPSYLSDPFVGWFFAMGFSKVVHSVRVAEIYRDFPGVLSSQPDAYGCRTFCPFPVYPALHGNAWTYLFENHGPGIRDLYYVYFRCVDQDPVLVGTYRPFEEETAPDWWEEASANFSEFRRS